MARNYRFFLRNQDSHHYLQQDRELFRLDEKMEPEIIFQLTKVLRVKAGDGVTLVSGTGSELGTAPVPEERVFLVQSASKNGVDLKFQQKIANANELSFPLELMLCLPNKPDKLEFILQKAVELGATRICLFDSDFSQMKHQLRTDRLEKIVIEAAEQSERAVVPKVEMCGNLADFLRTRAGNAAGATDLTRAMHAHDATDAARGPIAAQNIWVAMERANSPAAANPFVNADWKAGITVLIGPEGGFSDAEKQLFNGLGLTTFSLGKRILRMETAAVLSLGLASVLDA